MTTPTNTQIEAGMAAVRGFDNLSLWVSEETVAAIYTAMNNTRPTGDDVVEKALSEARAQNPWPAFSDENAHWNEGFSAAWATVRAAIKAIEG